MSTSNNSQKPATGVGSSDLVSRYRELKRERRELRLLLFQTNARWAALKLKLQLRNLFECFMQFCFQDSYFLFQLRDPFLTGRRGPESRKSVSLFRRIWYFFVHIKDR